MLVAQIVVGGAGATPVVTKPSGWTTLRTTDNGTDVQLSSHYLLRTGTSEPANYTWLFDASYEAAGGITTLRNTHKDGLRIVNIENGQTTASGTSHSTPSVTNTHTDCHAVIGLAVRANATWTASAATYIERFDTRSTGALPIAVTGGTDPMNAIAANSATGTSSAAGVGCAHIFVILPGLCSRGTPTSQISIVDDTLSDNGTDFGFDEINEYYPNEFVNLNLGRESYQAEQTLALGGTTSGNSTPTTTLIDTACSVTFDSAKTMTWSSLNTANSFMTLGTKVTNSIGDASAKDGVVIIFGANSTLRGTVKLYGCFFVQAGTSTANTTMTSLTDGVSEAVSSIFQGPGSISFGSSTGALSLIENVRVANTGTGNSLGTIFSNSIKNWGIVCSAPATSHGQITTDNIVTKDIQFFGDPVTSDLRWSASSKDWQVIRPIWSGNANKFSTATSNVPALTDATLEMWKFDVKVTDVNGAPIANVPLLLTDDVGNVQVNATTNSEGRVTFGSGLTANMVTVQDHYAVGTTWTKRNRWPFLLELNTGGSALPAYGSWRYYFDWPGADDEIFEDVLDVLPLQFATGNPTSWTECTI